MSLKVDDDPCHLSATSNCGEASSSRRKDSFRMEFSENNPSLLWKDRTSESSALKETFAKFDVSQPISSEILGRTRYLCAKYLGGAWSRLRLENFQMKAITGGMSNLLFLVSLPDSVELHAQEPRRALLRIHCQADLEQLLTESVVFTLLSERALGPKLLGVFPGGRFEQFIPSRALSCDEVGLPSISREVAPMLARVHTLDVPITKAPQVMETAGKWLEKFATLTNGQGRIAVAPVRAKEWMRDEYPKEITYEWMKQEMEFIEEFLYYSNSPVVFSHNDLQEGNILLADGFNIDESGQIVRDKSVETDAVEPLTFIDFEYCSYNYRGFDLGNHFCEFGIDYIVPVEPAWIMHLDRFEATESKRIFCEAYLDEVYRLRDLHDNPNFPSDLVTGNREDDLARLVEEGTMFMALSSFFWTCWGMCNGVEPVVQFDYNAYASDRLVMYLHKKPELIKFMQRVKNN